MILLIGASAVEATPALNERRTCTQYLMAFSCQHICDCGTGMTLYGADGRPLLAQASVAS